MTAISIGPLLFAGERLAAFLGMGAFLIVAAIVSRRFKGLEASAFNALVVGLLVARLAHVALHWSTFSEEPERIVMIWQGGFAFWPGLAAAAITLLVALRRRDARVAGFCALLFGLFVWNLAVQLVATTDTIAAPETEMATLDGRTVSISDFEGRPLVVNLWATWCPPCRREMPMMTEMAAARDDVAFVFANQGEGPSEIIRYFAQAKLAADHVTLDLSMALARHYGVRGYPATLFIGADGTLRSMHFGEVSREALVEAIDKISEKEGS
jgi:thiol-disulfide isomerase/thioredoxin